MYSLLVKKVGEPSYKSVKKFRTYEKAYYFVGNKLQTKHNLHYSYSVKYLMCGYDKKKIFPFILATAIVIKIFLFFVQDHFMFVSLFVEHPDKL
jgi:hypothetical protein